MKHAGKNFQAFRPADREQLILVLGRLVAEGCWLHHIDPWDTVTLKTSQELFAKGLVHIAQVCAKGLFSCLRLHLGMFPDDVSPTGLALPSHGPKENQSMLSTWAFQAPKH